MSIYKACDIRGEVCSELSEERYRRWGLALGRTVAPNAPFLAGGDVRESTPRFLASLVEGLAQAGAAVLNLGQLPTPVVYFAKRHYRAAGCAIVTASHNPYNVNGLKWMIGSRPPTPEDVQRLKASTEESGERLGDRCDETHGMIRQGGSGWRRQEIDTVTGPGKSPAARRIGPLPLEAAGPEGLEHGAVRPPTPPINAKQVKIAYRDWLLSRWTSHVDDTRLRIVVDPMWGCWSGEGVALLETAFPNVRFEAIHNEARGNFGGQGPDPSRSERLAELGETVRRREAALGVAFDGDGDRVAWVDEEGISLSPEQAAWTLLQSFGDKLSGECFVYDLKFSDRVAEAAVALGAQPLAERSGHAFIRTRMIETEARFGAEVSGHYFYGELEGGDDGLDTACRMIAFVMSSRRSLGQWRRACPAIAMTPDLRLKLPRDRQSNILKLVAERFRDCPQSTLDGVRVEFDEGWLLVRSSVTEPALTFRFEGRGRDSLSRLVRRVCDAMDLEGEQLWQAFLRHDDSRRQGSR